MTPRFRTLAAATLGMFLNSFCALGQNYTISAKPGVVNYIEGTAYLNDAKLSELANRNTVMSAGDSLSTDNGKAEVLLAPGVFLRIGEQSEIRMTSPSLVDTQVAIIRGEAIIEAAGLIKGSTVQVTDHGATITIEKNGLYRFKADEPPSAAVLEGKAQVYVGQEKLQLGKNHETVLAAGLKSQKFNPKQEDELYAWSNIRSEYEAAASYQAAKTAASAGYGGFGYGYGGDIYDPGWYWNSAFNSWAWLPAYGAFYSPFGWGFYSPAVVGYAPFVTTGVYRGGHWDHNGNGTGNWQHHHHWNGTSTTAAVPVRTDRPPAVGVIAASPWATQQARTQAARSLAATGTFNPAAARSNSFGPSAHIATPAPAAVRGGGWSAGPSGGHGAGAGGGGWSGGHASGSGGGWSGGAHSGGFSGGGAAGSGGHAGGGGGGGHH
jgi:hypothetical protein